MSGEKETLAELKAYRAKVYEEVVRRAELVKKMTSDLAAADFMVSGASGAASPPHVSATELQRREAIKATMKRRRQELVAKHNQALGDLHSAEERLAQVDEQIQEAQSERGLTTMISEDE